MRVVHFAIGLVVMAMLCVSCEELIQLDLSDAGERVVIEADITDVGPNVIYVTRSVSVDDSIAYQLVRDASVEVFRGDQRYVFNFIPGSGGYSNSEFPILPVVGGDVWQLRVVVDGEVYESTERVVSPYVEVDSSGTVRETILGEDYYFASFKFQDPAGQRNFYKYSISVDDGPMEFFDVYNDKFNDGLAVTHQIGGRNVDIQLNSEVRIKRQCISESVFNYWNEIQSVNPGSLAPANPTSNISNGALGYFSVSSSKLFTFRFDNFVSNSEEENSEDGNSNTRE